MEMLLVNTRTGIMATDRNRMKCDRFCHTLKNSTFTENKNEPYQVKLCLIWAMKSICNKLSNARAQYYSLTEILALMKTNVFTKLGSYSNSAY